MEENFEDFLKTIEDPYDYLSASRALFTVAQVYTIAMEKWGEKSPVVKTAEAILNNIQLAMTTAFTVPDNQLN